MIECPHTLALEELLALARTRLLAATVDYNLALEGFTKILFELLKQDLKSKGIENGSHVVVEWQDGSSGQYIFNKIMEFGFDGCCDVDVYQLLDDEDSGKPRKVHRYVQITCVEDFRMILRQRDSKIDR